MSKSTTVNKNWFNLLANGGCESLLQSMSMGSQPFANGRCQSLLQSTSMGFHPLLIVDVKVYYSQQEWVHTLC